MATEAGESGEKWGVTAKRYGFLFGLTRNI